MTLAKFSPISFFSTFRDDELEEKLKVSQHFIRIMMATATAPFSSEKEGFTGGYYKKQTNVYSVVKGHVQNSHFIICGIREIHKWQFSVFFVILSVKLTNFGVISRRIAEITVIGISHFRTEVKGDFVKC